MGTKSKPGQFDCHAKAEPDEPTFTLLGRDPLGTHLVEIWSCLRDGDPDGAREALELALQAGATQRYPRTGHNDELKAAEARNCADAMLLYSKGRGAAVRT
jgi:hypothetical protein